MFSSTDFLWFNQMGDTSARSLVERARVPYRGSYYVNPLFAMVNNCGCSEPLVDSCGNKPMLVTADDLVNNSYLDRNIDRKLLHTATLFSQDLLERHLGICFMNKLYAWKIDNTVVNEFDTAFLIKEYLLPVIAYKVLSELAVPLSMKEKSLGVVSISGDSFSRASTDDITYLKQYYEYKYLFYLDRLEYHLRCIKQYCLCHIKRYKTNVVL